MEINLAGLDTKIMKNCGKIHLKRTKLDLMMNKLVILVKTLEYQWGLRGVKGQLHSSADALDPCCLLLLPSLPPPYSYCCLAQSNLESHAPAHTWVASDRPILGSLCMVFPMPDEGESGLKAQMD